MGVKIKTRACAHCAGTGSVPEDGSGKLLRAERVRAKVSLRKLAEALKISYGYLGDMERGHRTLSTGMAQRYLSELEGLRNGK